MNSSIRNIIIVGGGTAAWSAAACLSRNRKLQITVIESPTIPIIGVGESTIPLVNLAHKRMGFDLFNTTDWLDEVDGTVKLSIEFGGFREVGSLWVHPFFMSNGVDFRKLAVATLEGRKQSDIVYEETQFGMLRRSGFVDNQTWKKHACAGTDAAYQVNAALYAGILKRECLKRDNLSHISADVTRVHIGDDGKVATLELANSELRTADLFVDCSGMSSLLIDAVGSTFIDIGSRLIVDSVIVAPLEYLDRPTQMQNATYCHALSSGWVWNIPLQSRIGSGYIYSSAHISATDAMAEFKQHLQSAYGYDPSALQVRKIMDFRTGYREKSWTSNVVAIGMSSFFAEPIESTAIAVFQNDALKLSDLLLAEHISDQDKAERYNKDQTEAVRSIVEFAELHYLLTERSDTPFWQFYKNKPYSPIQRKILETYLNPSPDLGFDYSSIKKALGGNSLFDSASYLLMFLGYGLLPKSGLAVWK